MRKIILIILDGIGDLPIAKLGNKTPLGAARKPNLNALAFHAKLGLMQPIKGIAPESGAAQYAILGYDLNYCPRRGPLEALGIGYKLKKGEIAIRCNFARVREKKIIDVRMKIPPQGIIEKLNKIDPEIRIIPTIDYRAVMIVKNASDDVSNTHPGYEKYGKISRAVTRTKIERICRGERNTCKRINKFIANAEKILRNGTILLRDAGKKPKNVKKMRNWSIIADMPVEIGLGKFLGMEVIKRGRDEVRQIVDCRKKFADLHYCGPFNALRTEAPFRGPSACAGLRSWDWGRWNWGIFGKRLRKGQHRAHLWQGFDELDFEACLIASAKYLK